MSADPHELAERLNALARAHMTDEQMEHYARELMQGGAFLRITTGKDGEVSVDVIPSSDLYLWT